MHTCCKYDPKYMIYCALNTSSIKDPTNAVCHTGQYVPVQKLFWQSVLLQVTRLQSARRTVDYITWAKHMRHPMQM